MFASYLCSHTHSHRCSSGRCDQMHVHRQTQELMTYGMCPHTPGSLPTPHTPSDLYVWAHADRWGSSMTFKLSFPSVDLKRVDERPGVLQIKMPHTQKCTNTSTLHKQAYAGYTDAHSLADQGPASYTPHEKPSPLPDVVNKLLHSHTQSLPLCLWLHLCGRVERLQHRPHCLQSRSYFSSGPF